MNYEFPVNPVSSSERSMGMLTHLLAIFTGFIGPLIIWLIKKDESAFVDHHGKEALNFQISIFIYYLVSGILTFILIGFLLAAAVAIIDLVFCITAAVKANQGEKYRYPLSIRIIS